MSEEPSKLDISDEMIAERRGGSNKMPNDMPRWMANSIIKIDKFSKIVGNVVCWILMPLIFAMTYEVLARKLFLAPLYGLMILADFFMEHYLCLVQLMLYQKEFTYEQTFYIEILKLKHKAS